MVHPLYWVTALTCAIVLAMILVHDRQELNRNAGEEAAFRRLILWVLYFSLQDTVWGLCAGTNRWGNWPLFAASTVFHFSTVTTTYFWLNYVLIYLGDEFRHRRLTLGLDLAVIGVQCVMLAVNLFVPVIFSVRDGLYITELLRPVAFLNQYLVYVMIGLLMLVRMRRASGEARNKAISVFCFALAPILTGVFQLLYPDAPFYTIGYFLGTIIIHLFIVQNDRIRIQNLNFEIEHQASRLKIAEQIALSNTDMLTGLPNRRAYEEAIAAQSHCEDLIYISIDINELKIVNDTLGHAAGDELLSGAADCLRQALGRWGKVYRIGGDEFVALLHTAGPLAPIMEGLIARLDAWQGKLVSHLTASFGAAEQREFPGLPVTELARIADDRMYAHKTAYYLNKGIDRQGMHMAYTALCLSYDKILRVNLNRDSFRIIAMNSRDIPGYSEKKTLSEWRETFGRSGMVHPDDLEEYLTKTENANLRTYFASGGKHFTVFYRRRGENGYNQTMMEIMPAEDYTHDNQQVYLYVKNIDRVR